MALSLQLKDVVGKILDNPKLKEVLVDKKVRVNDYIMATFEEAIVFTFGMEGEDLIVQFSDSKPKVVIGGKLHVDGNIPKIKISREKVTIYIEGLPFVKYVDMDLI